MVRIEVKRAEVDRLLAKGARLGAVAAYRVRNVVDDVALHVQKRAVKRAPIEQGHLRRSGTSETRLQGGSLVATVQFGGLAEAYAEVQHEREDFEHPKGGQAHYLYGAATSAWNAAEQRMAETVVLERLRDELE